MWYIQADFEDLFDRLEAYVTSSETTELNAYFENHLSGKDPDPSLYRDLSENRDWIDLDNDVFEVVLWFLILQDFDILESKQVPEQYPESYRFLQQSVAKWGNVVEASYMKLHSPNKWRYLMTTLNKGGRTGPSFRTRILKWNGNTEEVSSIPADVVQFAIHLLKNLSGGMESLSDMERERVQRKLQTLKKFVADLDADPDNKEITE